MEFDAGAAPEAASPIQRRPTPLVDMLPRPRFFSGRPKPRVAQVAVLEPKLEVTVEPKAEPRAKPRAKPSAEPKPTVTSGPKWQRSLNPVNVNPAKAKDIGPAEVQAKARPKVGALASISFVLTLGALSAVLLTIAFFLSKTTLETPEATEAFEIPVNEPDDRFAERQFPKPAAKRAVQREPVEFAELLHRDATPDAESQSDRDDSF